MMIIEILIEKTIMILMIITIIIILIMNHR